MQLLNLNYMGFVALRNSPEVIADITQRAERIAEAAGDGFEVKPVTTNYSISGRARTAVVATTYEAMLAEATDNALTGAIDAGR